MKTKLQSMKTQLQSMKTKFRGFQDAFAWYAKPTAWTWCKVGTLTKHLQASNLEEDCNQERAQSGRFKNGHGHRRGVKGNNIDLLCSLFCNKTTLFWKSSINNKKNTSSWINLTSCPRYTSNIYIVKRSSSYKVHEKYSVWRGCNSVFLDCDLVLMDCIFVIKIWPPFCARARF